MLHFDSILRCVVSAIFALVLLFSAKGLAAGPVADTLPGIDAKREELQRKLEQLHSEPNRMYRRIGLAETHINLLFLDYDDPRTKLGAAVAMSNISHEQLVEILYEMVFARQPTDEEEQQCLMHLEKHADDLKLAVKDIMWAMCNSREFVDRVDN